MSSALERLRAKHTKVEPKVEPKSTDAKPTAVKKDGVTTAKPQAKVGRAKVAVRPSVRVGIKPVQTKSEAKEVKAREGSSSGRSVPLGNPLSRAQQLLKDAQEKIQTKQDEGFYTVSGQLPEELDADTISTKLADLDMALLAKTPELPTLQLEIMRNLRQYEELVHILNDDQLGIIVSGALELANVNVAQGSNGAAKTKKTQKQEATDADFLLGSL